MRTDQYQAVLEDVSVLLVVFCLLLLHYERYLGSLPHDFSFLAVLCACGGHVDDATT